MAQRLLPIQLLMLLAVSCSHLCCCSRLPCRAAAQTERSTRTASPSARSSRSRPRIARRKKTTRAASWAPDCCGGSAQPKPGWGFHWGFNWYAVKLERPIGGTAIELGELHVRPFMAGYGYTHVIRPLLDHRRRRSAAMPSARSTSAIRRSPRISRTLGVPAAEANATNTLVLKPEIGVWYDMTKKVFLNVNAGYMIARPDVEHRHVRGHRQAQGARRSVHPQGRRRLFHLLIAAILRGIFDARAGLKQA